MRKLVSNYKSKEYKLYCSSLFSYIGTIKEGFNKSWFDTSAQTSSTCKEALFTNTLATQIASFHKNGFAVIRRGVNQDKASLTNLEADILQHLSLLESSYLYRLKRFLGISLVRAAEKRHAIALPSSSLLLRVIKNAINTVFPILQSQMSLNSSLVDLSSIISLPGSERQKTHSDIMFSKSDKIIAGFVALSHVKLTNGPTCLFAGSHKKGFHMRHVDNDILRQSHYTADGSLEVEQLKSEAGNKTVEHVLETSSETNDINEVMSSLPYAAVLEIGDILIYDSQIFHFGGANVSLHPRVLLMFAFQQCPPWGVVNKINGFTYHCHSSVLGKYNLNDFKL